MNFQKKTKGTRIITIALTVLLCVGTVYTGVYAEEKEDAAANPVSGLKTTPAASAQAKHSVIYEAGEYFILFDGATEKDLPGSTGPDFGVTFGAVWPDAYVSFDSYHVNKNLVKKMKKECSYWRGKGWLTKKEANAILAVAAKVQKGDTGSFKISRQEREYAQWGITKRNGFYYYKNQRIRVIMDIRAFHARSSFHNFYYHAKGSIDLKIIRGNHNKIKKVVFLSKERADAILSDMGVKR